MSTRIKVREFFFFIINLLPELVGLRANDTDSREVL